MAESPRIRPKSIVFLGTAHDNGGSSILATNLAEAMRADGHHVEEWYLFDSPAVLPPGARLFVNSERARSPFTLIAMFARVIAELRARKPDAVFGLQSLANLITGIGGWLAGIRNRVPTYHSAIDRQNATLMKIDRVFGRIGLYTRIVTCAETVAETFVPNGPSYARRLAVIVNGQKKAASFSRDEARRELGLPATGTIVGQIGRLSYQKNQAFAVDLIKDVPDTRLLFVGHGPDEDDVKTAVKAAGLKDRVIFIRAVDYPRIGLFYAAVDAVLFPSRFEGLSLAAIEALHAGTPLLCSDIPSFRELFRNSQLLTDHLLAPLEDRDAWLAKLRAVLHDRAVRDRVIAEMARLSPDFSFDTMARRYLDVLD